jgi:tetratricopeptide (TPR) repeat protein
MIRGLAPLVFKIANQGDAIAHAIIRDIGLELGTAAGAILRRLKLTDSDCDVILGGSVVHGEGEILLNAVCEIVTSNDPAKAEADYLSAVRAGEGLIKLRTDAEAVTLFGQALIGSKQYARAAAALERASTESDATGVTFYLLGVAHSRATNFPRAIAALETAAKKTPNDVNVYRELGYAFEVTKQYSKALAAYEKGSTLAPSDPDLKESIERVKPFAK